MKRLLMTCAVAVTMFILTGQANGNTLITDSGNNRVIEVDSSGTIVWVKTGLYHPIDAERLANGNTLIADMDNQRVIEVNSDDTIVWKKTGLKSPVDAERLANGNTLIAEWAIGLIEVDESGATVWEITGLAATNGVERLANGNTLIAGLYGVIEINSLGTIIWEKTGLALPVDAKRLANGNTLIVDTWDDRVIEVNVSKSVVWEKTGLNSPSDAERLANGNTLIADTGNNRVIEVDSSGTIVWVKTGLFAPCDAERICPPMPPHEPWSFVQITDPHIGYKEGEVDAAINILDQTIISILNLKPLPKFVLVTGDIADYGCNRLSGCGNHSHYDRFDESMEKLVGKGIQYRVVPGNHDRTKKFPFGGSVEDWWDCDCSLEGLCCFAGSFGYSYSTDSFLYNDFLFIGLDSGASPLYWLSAGPGEGLTNPQYQYLSDLGKGFPCKPKILYMHHPPLTDLARTKGQTDDGTINLFDWCANNRVQLVLAGHTHQDHTSDRDSKAPTDGTKTKYVQTPSCGIYRPSHGDDIPGFRVIDVADGLASPQPYQTWRTYWPDRLSYVMLSPGNMHIYGPDGGHVGIGPGGEVEYGIADSFYHRHYTVENEEGVDVFPEQINIFDPPSDCLCEIVGAENGTYGLVLTYVSGGIETLFQANDIPTSPGARHVYAVNWAALSAGEEDAVVLGIDTDGDGVFERTVYADEDLTSEEFALQTETVIDFEPDTLNLRSPGKVVTAYIELPEGFDVSDIVISSLKLNNSVSALSKPVKIGDYDEDGIADLMVKFDRQQVAAVLEEGVHTVHLSGQLTDETLFAGMDIIRVIGSIDAEAAKPEFDSTMPEEFIAGMEDNLQTTTDDSVDIGGEDAFGVKEAVGFMLFEADGIIGELGPESFNNEESAFELACALNDVFTMLDEGMYFEVMVILEGDILERMDGCANIGEPDEDDWVTSIEGQALLYPLVTETIELLESML